MNLKYGNIDGRTNNKYPYLSTNIISEKRSDVDNYGLGPAQDVHFFYTRSHLIALQNCALIFSISF